MFTDTVMPPADAPVAEAWTCTIWVPDTVAPEAGDTMDADTLVVPLPPTVNVIDVVAEW